MKVKSALLALSTMGLLSACSGNTEPYVYGWNSDNYYRLDSESFDEKYDFEQNKILVRVCFDQTEHTKEQVFQLAKETCAERLTLKNQISLSQQNEQMAQQSQISTAQLSGPVLRQRKLEQMIASIKLSYEENDKWECSLLHPNRITLTCSYSDTYRAPVQRNTVPQVDMDLPPELPADLRPE